MVRERALDARNVGVVAARRRRREVDRVHRADPTRDVAGFDRVQDVLFERDRDVQSRDPERVGRPDRLGAAVASGLERDVSGVQSERVVRGLVHRRRQRVFDRVPEKTEYLHARSCRRGRHKPSLVAWERPSAADSARIDPAANHKNYPRDRPNEVQ